MSSPTQAGGIPPELQKSIDKYIQQETQRILQAAQPQAAPELTPGEQAHLLVVRIGQLEASEKSRPSSSGPTHAAILGLLALLTDAAYPAPANDEEKPDAPATLPLTVAAGSVTNESGN